MRLIALLVLVVTAPAYPCTKDIDCEHGATCIKKQAYQLEGVCSSGRDLQDSATRMTGSLPPQQFTPCTSDINCRYGERCIKGQYEHSGKCN